MTTNDRPLSVAYATSRALREDSVVPACENGVDVVVWAFAHMEIDDNNEPRIRETFDLKGVAETKMRAPPHVKHLVAFGGWNGPHPDERIDGAEWYEIFREWNRDGLFDGVDWDLEGHDDPDAPTTILSEAVVDIVVEFTRLARLDGYAVGAAPAESYLDAKGDGTVSNRWNHQPLAPWSFDFPYAGRNAYVRFLRKGADFDFISLQFYEGYSRACYETTVLKKSLADYLVEIVTVLTTTGFRTVDEENNSDSFLVKIPAEKLVLGFANDWADGSKFLKADPEQIAIAFRRLRQAKIEPRGTMFWVIDEDKGFASDLNGRLVRGLTQSSEL